MTKLNSVPTLFTDNSSPICRGSGEEKLECKCGHVLIVGYEPRQYSGIGFKCYRCDQITLSDTWPDGEPLPRQIIPLRGSGGYFFSDTVDLRQKAGFASEQEIERVLQATVARPPIGSPLDLTPEGLNALETRFNQLSSGEMYKASESAQRAAKGGNLFYLKSHLAWAINYVRTCIGVGSIDLDDERTQAAFTFMQMAGHLFRRWEHHPLFPLISKSIVLEYPHAVTQLLAATYLSDQGITTGFNNPADFSGQSPDLFINANPLETISIEVKAPQELQWPNRCPSPAALEDLLAKHILKASKQITGEWGGVVVLGASWASDGGHAALTQALQNLDKRMKISSRVAGVVSVSINILGHYRLPYGEGLGSTISSNVGVQLNSRFSGEQFLNQD